MLGKSSIFLALPFFFFHLFRRKFSIELDIPLPPRRKHLMKSDCHAHCLGKERHRLEADVHLSYNNAPFHLVAVYSHTRSGNGTRDLTFSTWNTMLPGEFLVTPWGEYASISCINSGYKQGMIATKLANFGLA